MNTENFFIEKRYIFHYDKTQPAWKNHSKLCEHDGSECSALIFTDDELNPYDKLCITFDDGFQFLAFIYELEEINK